MASSGGTLFQVNSIVTHPEYNVLTNANDIAVLQVAGLIVYSTNIQAAPIGGQLYVLPDGEIVQAAGWGRTSYMGLSSERLRDVDVAIINQESCHESYVLHAERVIESSMMCVGWNGGGRGQCIGDTGGPLYHNNVLIGIYSFSAACGLNVFPSINTRVNQYLDFITANA